jgi:hypothetical protein
VYAISGEISIPPNKEEKESGGGDFYLLHLLLQHHLYKENLPNCQRAQVQVGGF